MAKDTFKKNNLTVSPEQIDEKQPHWGYQPKNMGTLEQPEYLPNSRLEMERLGWDELDILLIQGDAYIDHPAQGPALLGRWLIAHGFKVGLVSQPRWQNGAEAALDLTVMGRPRLFAALSAGSMDSMLAHYTAFRKKRSDDALTPGGLAGARPNRATLVYTGLARAAFPGLPIFIGGLEASLRRLSHYDFWQEKLRRSVLLESKADLLIYGPGERPLLELAQRLRDQEGEAVLSGVLGTVEARKADEALQEGWEVLPAHEAMEAEPPLLMEATVAAERLAHQGGVPAFQASGARAVLVNPPAEPLSTAEMDFLYQLPFKRRAHPSYQQPIPALELLKTSLTTHRGCGGGCSFCSLALHQGRKISSRSQASIVAEARRLGQAKAVALSDVGAATANFWGAECLQAKSRKVLPGELKESSPAGSGPKSGPVCQRKSCLWPQICPSLKVDQKAWLELLEAVAQLPGIKQVRVASGVRYDLALTDEKSLIQFLNHFVGGQLKVAPEHLDPTILNLMRKPGPKVFERFLAIFEKFGPKEQYLVPYLISAFPGSGRAQMRSLSQWFESRYWRPRQVQAFIPTPGTVATAMYYSGVDENKKPLSVATSDSERLSQHSFLIPQEGGASFSKGRNGPRSKGGHQRGGFKK